MQLRIPDVARIMRVSERVVEKWIGSGGLPIRRLQQTITIDQQELLDWAIVQGVVVYPELLEQGSSFVGSQWLHEAVVNACVLTTSEASFAEDAERLACELYPDEALLAAGFSDRFKRGVVTGFLSRGATAIPHPRYPLLARASAPRLIVCYLHSPMPLLAASSVPIQTLIAVASVGAKQHVRLVAALSNQLADGQLGELLSSRASLGELNEHLSRRAQEETESTEDHRPSALRLSPTLRD